VRATAVEHEAEEKVPARAAETSIKDGAAPSTELAGGELARLPPGLLLSLQARAGNAAVAGLIEARRKPEALPTAEPASIAAITPQSPPSFESAAPPALENEAEPAAESTTAPRPGETDDALSELDGAADAPPIAGEAEPAETQELVARDAQADLADLQANSGDESSEPSSSPEPGVAIEPRPPPRVPDVAAAEPAAGLARIGGLPPAQLLGSLGSVAVAVDRDVAHAEERLAASPPQRPRHPGAPSTVGTPASTRIQPAERPTIDIARVPEAHGVEIRHPVAPPLVPEATAPNGQLPTHDPGLDLKLGPVPQLPVAGNADPSAVHQQHSHVVRGVEQEHLSGQKDAAQPLGEDEIYPTAPAETLRAAVAQASANGHRPAPAAEDDEAASIIAQQEKSGEIQGAITGGLASLAAERQAHEQRTASERSKADAEMAQLEQANASEQAGERAATKREVAGLRGQWTGAQQELVAGAQREADAKTSETLQTVAQERGSAEQQAAAHYEEGQREADQARRLGEEQAAVERQKAQKQSPGGLLGAIGSAVGSLFDKAKQAVQGVFDKARQLVRGAIEKAQQLAAAVMERARQAIVGAIRLAGSALVAIGDRVLVAFPKLRDRFRKAIQDRIAAAEAVVNRLSTALKLAVQTSLNLLGAALSAAIGLLHRGMQAAIDGVRTTVQGALDFARNAISAFGTFAALVRDIAANPGRWIANLAAAVRDGIRNHLWPDLKAGVQGWFNEKVDSILGLGTAVWSLLKRGGIGLAQVASFAWEAIKSMIPQTVIWVLIEKLVSLIVPAAAAVLLIIQALQAAWGSLGRILQAFDAFIAFLKGVRWGNAGGLFGKALAAGAIAVIEFISQFLLQRLMGAASAVAGKLRTLAKRIGSRLAAVGRGIVRGAKWLGGKARKLGGKFKGFVRQTIARPQVRWHAWRLKRTFPKDSVAGLKVDHLVRDPSLDPTLKLEFLMKIKPALRVSATDPWDEMAKVVGSDPTHWCLKGRVISPDEVFSKAPLTKLVSLRKIYNEMLEPTYKQRFTDFDDWQSALAKEPRAFDARLHIKGEAEMGRFWSPRADANEGSLEEAIAQRQLDPATYQDGALRVHLSPENAAGVEFHKPTAFDAIFFDRWQVPKRRGAWGTITTKKLGASETIVIHEAVSNPVKRTMISDFEPMLPASTRSSADTAPMSVPTGAFKR
jgi:hypothetical protein